MGLLAWPSEVLLKLLWLHCRMFVVVFSPLSVEEMQTGGLLYPCTRQFAHCCLWVGDGCDGKCEQWQAGTRKEPFTKQRHDPLMPFSACAHNKERSEAHICSLIHPLTLMHSLPSGSFCDLTLAWRCFTNIFFWPSAAWKSLVLLFWLGNIA